jgi:hypothetical protein
MKATTQTTAPVKGKISKIQLVKNWLLSGRTLTHRQCSQLFGADRLADIIYKLRKSGLRISGPLNYGEDRFLNKVRFSRYKWLGELPVIRKKASKKKGYQSYVFIHRFPMKPLAVRIHILNYLHKQRHRVKSIVFPKQAPGIAVATTMRKTKKIFHIRHLPQN